MCECYRHRRRYKPRTNRLTYFQNTIKQIRPSEKGGLGWALYLCNVLIEIQEGKISLTSEIGKGSTFSFYIPYE
jgi:signal transduction histidine kinase